MNGVEPRNRNGRDHMHKARRPPPRNSRRPRAADLIADTAECMFRAIPAVPTKTIGSVSKSVSATLDIDDILILFVKSLILSSFCSQLVATRVLRVQYEGAVPDDNSAELLPTIWTQPAVLAVPALSTPDAVDAQVVRSSSSLYR